MELEPVRETIPEPVPNPDYYPVYPDNPGYYTEVGNPFSNV